MKKAGLVTLIVLVGLMFSYVPAQAGLSGPEKGRIGIEVISWWPQVMGNATLDTKYIKGTELDLENDLDVDPTVTTVELGVWLNLTKRNRFSFYWFEDQRDGSNVLNETVKVAGKDYIANAQIDSNIKVQRYKFLYERAIIRRDQGRLALGVGVSYLDAYAKIEGFTSVGVSDSESKRVQLALPVISGAAEIHLPFGLGVFAEGCGFGLKYSYVDAKYYDVRGGVNWKSRFVYAQAGYQYIALRADAYDKIKVEYGLQGPFVSAGAKF